MRLLTVLLIALLSTALQAQTVQPQCQQLEFSGEAVQGQQFSQELGGDISLSILSTTLKEDARWGWFQLRVIGKDKRSGFVFNPSDRNWLLATDFNSAFIGGANSDVKAALSYRLRYFIFPIVLDDKERLRNAALRLNSAKTQREIRSAGATLRSMRLGHLRFEITDYRLSDEIQPMSVGSVRFSAKVTLPPEFPASPELLVTRIDCPEISDEVVKNIRNPERHSYFLPPNSLRNPER